MAFSHRCCVCACLWCSFVTDVVQERCPYCHSRNVQSRPNPKAVS
jgi:RNA polymerase subunit RPABC4/transcription elongation factor Spt4